MPSATIGVLSRGGCPLIIADALEKLLNSRQPLRKLALAAVQILLTSGNSGFPLLQLGGPTREIAQHLSDVFRVETRHELDNRLTSSGCSGSGGDKIVQPSGSAGAGAPAARIMLPNSRGARRYTRA